MQELKKNVVFQGVSTSTPGGTEVLIANLIQTAQETPSVGVKTFCNCSPGTFIHDELTARGLGNTVLSTDDLPQAFGLPNTVYVCWGFEISRLFYLAANSNLRNVPILFWSLLPGMLLNQHFHARMPGVARRSRRLAAELFERLGDAGSLAFMDGPTRQYAEDFCRCKFSSRIIPVPIIPYIAPRTQLSLPPGNFRVTYCARSNQVWKIWPAEYIARQIAGYIRRSGVPIEFTILTDEVQPFKTIIGSRDHVSYVTGLKGPQLHQYLRDKSALHISMGTAALDAGIIGVPTVLIDASSRRFPDTYLPRYLHHAEECCLGVFDWQGHDVEPRTGIDHIIDHLRSPMKYEAVSQASHTYASRNHSAASSLRLLTQVDASFPLREFVRQVQSANDNWASQADKLIFHHLLAPAKKKFLRTANSLLRR